jgi:hypothetical protein
MMPRLVGDAHRPVSRRQINAGSPAAKRSRRERTRLTVRRIN